MVSPISDAWFLIDSLIPDHGGNLHNVHDIADEVTIHEVDLRDRPALVGLLRGQRWIFNLAGQVSHIDSMRDPHTDLEINCRSQLSILEACRQYNPGVKLVYAVKVRITRDPSHDLKAGIPADVILSGSEESGD